MHLAKPITALAVPIIASLVGQHYVEPAQPVVMVKSIEMPQAVPKEYARLYWEATATEESPGALVSAVEIYHSLRSDFSVSHTEMSGWLGVKRRTLYNWLNEPERSTNYGPKIELRLSSLLKLHDEMEPEHYRFLQKIAFSPIYGNPKFGEDILAGSSGESLSKWYEKLFSQFESYQAVSSNKDSIA